MNHQILNILGAAVLGVATLGSLSSHASELVYDNTVNDLDRSYSPGNALEFGDEVFLAGGTDFTITDFGFGTFVGTPTGAPPSGDEKVTVRFRLNDGAVLGTGRVAPGSVIYTSSPLPLGGGTTLNELPGLSVALPAGVDHFTWTAEFEGIDPDEQVGLLVAHPPVVGSSYDDFWKNDPPWNTYQIERATVPASFYAAVFAQVPDSSSGGLICGLAALGLFGRAWRGSRR